MIPYTLEAGDFAPEIYCNGLVAYKDGHLCTACEFVIEAALATRRTVIAAEAFGSRPDRLIHCPSNRRSPCRPRRYCLARQRSNAATGS